uniref:Retrotransposon gag domain-containing protein n=1 Tax=Arundo donax TaxID=35708 RepID=A0A0A9DEA6_ARUDO
MVSNVEELAKQFVGFELMMKQALDKLTGLESWRTTADSSLSTLLMKTEEAVARINTLESQPRSPSSASTTPVGAAPQHAAYPSASTSERPHGHGVDPQTRELGFGVLGAPPQLLANGTSKQSIPQTQNSPVEECRSAIQPSFSPKLEFPKFDGENSRLWKDRCEMYSEVYGVCESLKTRLAALNFTGAAALWLQTLELRGQVTSWSVLCSVVFDRFDRDQYQTCLRELDNLKQEGTIAEYYHKFEQLAHNILLYNTSFDSTYLVTRFLGGLREDIRAPIALHRPKDVDTASVLALLQEEELEATKKKLGAKSESKEFNKSSSWVFTTSEKSKLGVKRDDIKKPEKSPLDERWESLKAFCKAKGLCFTCGDKWAKTHKCPAQVPIHIVQELMENFQLDEGPDYTSSEDEEDTSEEVVLFVKDPPAKKTRRKTMRFRGYIGKQGVLILIDSGSVGTFISEEVAASMQQQDCELQQFTVADGGPMKCSKMIPKMQWLVQGHTFSYDARVLPLKCYDMIVGADWLEDHSPMWIHWRKKIMRFSHKGRRIQLTGLRDDLTKCKKISVHKLRGLIKRKAVTHCIQFQNVAPVCQLDMDNSLSSHPVPDNITELVQQHEALFQDPSELPPP